MRAGGRGIAQLTIWESFGKPSFELVHSRQITKHVLVSRPRVPQRSSHIGRDLRCRSLEQGSRVCSELKSSSSKSKGWLTRVVIDGQQELHVLHHILDFLREGLQAELEDPDGHRRVFVRVVLHHRCPTH